MTRQLCVVMQVARPMWYGSSMNATKHYTHAELFTMTNEQLRAYEDTLRPRKDHECRVDFVRAILHDRGYGPTRGVEFEPVPDRHDVPYFPNGPTPDLPALLKRVGHDYGDRLLMVMPTADEDGPRLLVVVADEGNTGHATAILVSVGGNGGPRYERQGTGTIPAMFTVLADLTGWGL